MKDIRTTERETASFEVVLSHADVPGSWLRNGVQLKPTNHWRISAKGHVHSLTVSNLAVEDTGSFSFCVENLKTSARLVVKGGWWWWGLLEVLVSYQTDRILLHCVSAEVLCVVVG